MAKSESIKLLNAVMSEIVKDAESNHVMSFLEMYQYEREYKKQKANTKQKKSKSNDDEEPPIKIREIRDMMKDRDTSCAIVGCQNEHNVLVIGVDSNVNIRVGACENCEDRIFEMLTNDGVLPYCCNCHQPGFCEQEYMAKVENTKYWCCSEECKKITQKYYELLKKGPPCSVCMIPGADQTCAKCKKPKYCSRNCQIKHWKLMGHKKHCGKSMESRALTSADLM